MVRNSASAQKCGGVHRKMIRNSRIGSGDSEPVAAAHATTGGKAPGIAMLALPGPGLLVIVAGLSILGAEFAWAARLRDQAKDRAAKTAQSAKAAAGKTAMLFSRTNTFLSVPMLVAMTGASTLF